MAVLIFAGLQGKAQSLRTGFGSNYGGYMALHNNPAMLADNRMKWQFVPFAYSIDVQNNYLRLSTPYSQYKVLSGKVPPQYLDANGVPLFEDYMLEEKMNGRKKYAYVNQMIQGPAFMMNLDDRSGIALGYSIHTEVYAAGLNESLLKIFVEDRDNLNPAYDVDANQKRLMGQSFEQRNFGVGAHAYASWNLSYARVLWDNKWHFLKGGITYKRLHGFGGGYFNVNRMGYELQGLDTVAFTNPDLSYGFVPDAYYSVYPVPYSFDHPSRGRRSQAAGTGHGASIGLVYEHRPRWNSFGYRMDGIRHDDPIPNKYDYRIALSLQNIGRIVYKWEYLDTNTRRIIYPSSRNVLGSGRIQWNDFDKSGGEIESTENFDSLVNSLFGPAVDGFYGMHLRLPMSLHLQIDYEMSKYFYLGIYYTQTMRRKDIPGIRMPNMLTLQTRYERKHWELSASMTMGNFYQPIHLGLMARCGPFFIGSDQTGTFLTPKKTSGLSIYTGFQTGMHQRRLKDSDGDGVSDKHDKCKDEFGTLECQGCPDRDQDGIPDVKDKCPDVFGDYYYDGCPIPE